MTEAHVGEKEFALRRANAQDEPDVATLIARLVEFGPPAWRDADRMVDIDRERVLRSLRSTEADPAVFVATCGNRIAGFVHLHSLVDQYHSRPHGHIEDIVVATQFEGRGVARLLMGAAEQWAKSLGFEWLTLSVFDQNSRARRIYENAGFGADILRMVKPLL
jgi:GNAT superfamily N-acetyltransferase